MDFRTLLLRIAERYNPGGEFTSSNLSRHLKMRKKGVSNDLRRLHRMGFLKRRRRSRLCDWSVGKPWGTAHRQGVPVMVMRRLRFLPCFKGIEYVYSLSRQGLSYVRWLKDSKPLEDARYLTLTWRVMEELPESTRSMLGLLGALRGDYRYRGPTRQLRLIDNPANPLLHTVLTCARLQDQNKALALELVKSVNSERSLNVRAQTAEKEIINLTRLCLQMIGEIGRLRADNEGLTFILSAVKLAVETVAKTRQSVR